MAESTESLKPADRKVRKRSVAIWLVVFNFAQAGTGFFVNLWLARKLGATEYGFLSYGLIVGGISRIFVGYSSEKTLVRDLVQSSDDQATLTASLALRSFMAVLVISICVVWTATSDVLGPKAWPVMLCGIWGALTALTSRAWLDSQYKMHINAAITFCEKAAYAVIVILLVRYGFEGDYAIVAASCLLLVRCVSLVYEWSYASKTFRLKFHDIRKNVLYLIQQNSLVLGAAVANLLMTHANQLLLEHERGSGQLAYYSIAFQIILMVQLFQSQIVRLLAPHTAKLTHPDNIAPNLRASIFRYMAYMFAASAAIVTPVVLLSPWLIKIALKEEYLAAIPALRILACWALIYGPALVLNQFLLGLRLQKSFFIVTMLAGALAIILGQLLVPIYGAISVAWVLLISHGFSIITQFVLVICRVNRLKVSPAEA